MSAAMRRAGSWEEWPDDPWQRSVRWRGSSTWSTSAGGDWSREDEEHWEMTDYERSRWDDGRTKQWSWSCDQWASTNAAEDDSRWEVDEGRGRESDDSDNNWCDGYCASKAFVIEDVPKQLSVWCSTERWCEFDFSSNGIDLHCHLRRPSRADGSSLVPLLLFLHSASFEPVGDLFPAGDAWLEESGIGPCFVLCPRCPDDYYWLLRGNCWSNEGGEWVRDDRGFVFWSAPLADEMASALVALLCEVASRAPVDPSRIILSGASMGGHGCWDLAARHPNLFSAVVPVAPHMEVHRVAWIAERLRDVPVWAFHGVGDFCCPFEDTAALVKKLGSAASLSVFSSGRDGQSVHNSTSLVAFVENRLGLFSWMLRQPPRIGAQRALQDLARNRSGPW